MTHLQGISDPQRNMIGQSTEMSLLVSMLLWTFLNPLNFLKNFNFLFVYVLDSYTEAH